MSAYPPLTAQVIGQAEKTLNAILDRLLAGTGLSEPQWVTLALAAASGGSASHERLTERIAGATKVSREQARTRLAELAAAGLLRTPASEDDPVLLTATGQRLHEQIRAATTEITGRLWGDLPAEDLATAGRVLSIATERASAELDRA